MKSYALFQEYIWLINTIYKAKKISLEDINSRWIQTEMSGGLAMVRSTFNRHKDAIQDMFGIYIECDRKDGFRYYIGNAEVLEEDSIQNWILSTMSVSSMLSENRSVHDRIILESIPSSGETLNGIIEAMKMSVRIKVRYKRYGSYGESEMILEPLCVRLFGRRWYAMVKFPTTDGIICLAVDRIMSLEITETKFVYNKDLDLQEHFRESFGMVNDKSVPVERIVLRAFGKEVFYLRDLPLHHSQREIASGEGYCDFEYTLRPTADFYSPILSRGASVRVLEPKALADEIRRLHKEALERYEE